MFWLPLGGLHQGSVKIVYILYIIMCDRNGVAKLCIIYTNKYATLYYRVAYLFVMSA